MISDAEKGRFQIALFFSFPCLADNLRQVILRLDRLQNVAVGIVSVYEGLDSTTSTGRKALGLIAPLASFEASNRAERIREGLQRAELVGTQSGLPPGRPRVDLDVVKVSEFHERGLSQREIAAELGVGLGTVHRALKENQTRWGKPPR